MIARWRAVSGRVPAVQIDKGAAGERAVGALPLTEVVNQFYPVHILRCDHTEISDGRIRRSDRLRRAGLSKAINCNEQWSGRLGSRSPRQGIIWLPHDYWLARRPASARTGRNPMAPRTRSRQICPGQAAPGADLISLLKTISGGFT